MLQPLQDVDLWLFQALTPWHSRWLDVAMSWISISGIGSAVWLVLATFGILRPSSRAGAWRVYLTILLCYVTVDLVMKPLIARPRPVSIGAYEPARALPPVPRTLSFPSGHTAGAVGAAIAISRIWPQGRVLWWTMAVLMGYSRIYLGHHYPLDVAGGVVVGALVALWVLGGTSRHRRAVNTPAGVAVRP